MVASTIFKGLWGEELGEHLNRPQKIYNTRENGLKVLS